MEYLPSLLLIAKIEFSKLINIKCGLKYDYSRFEGCLCVTDMVHCNLTIPVLPRPFTLVTHSSENLWDGKISYSA